MALLKRKQLTELSNDDLASKLNETRLELVKERAQIAIGGAASNPGRVGQLRRTTARLLTEKNKRRL